MRASSPLFTHPTLTIIHPVTCFLNFGLTPLLKGFRIVADEILTLLAVLGDTEETEREEAEEAERRRVELAELVSWGRTLAPDLNPTLPLALTPTPVLALPLNLPLSRHPRSPHRPLTLDARSPSPARMSSRCR